MLFVLYVLGFHLCPMTFSLSVGILTFDFFSLHFNSLYIYNCSFFRYISRPGCVFVPVGSRRAGAGAVSGTDGIQSVLSFDSA